MSGKVGIGIGCSLLCAAVIACATDRPEGATSSDITADKHALVISQIYASGGTADDGYDSDYVEIFNSGASAASMKDLEVAYFPQPEDAAVRPMISMFLPETDLAPGEHYLVKLTVPGTKGKVLTPFDHRSPQTGPEDDFPAALLPNGYLAIVAQASAPDCVLYRDANKCDAIDLVGIGSATRKEGSPITAIPAGQAMYRRAEGCSDTNDNASDFVASDPHPRSTSTLPVPCANTIAPAGDAGSADAGDTSDAGEPTTGDAGTTPADAGAKPTSSTKPTIPATGTDDREGQQGAVTTAETPTPTVAAPKETAPPASAASTCAMGTGPARTSLLGSLGLGLALAAFVRRRRPAR